MKIYGKENQGVCYVGLNGLVCLYDYKSNEFLRPNIDETIPQDVLEALCEDGLVFDNSIPVPVIDNQEFYDEVLKIRQVIRFEIDVREKRERYERDRNIVVFLMENYRFADAEVLCRLSGITLEDVYKNTMKYRK